MSDLNVEPLPDQAVWRADVVLDFARSELFDRTFQEGMALVEETASYLDGPGRQESKSLDRARGARLRRREHAADHPADAGRLMAAGAAGGARGRDGSGCAPARPATGWAASAPPAEPRADGLPERPARAARALGAALRAGAAPRPAHVPRSPARTERPHPVLVRSSKSCRPLRALGPGAVARMPPAPKRPISSGSRRTWPRSATRARRGRAAPGCRRSRPDGSWGRCRDAARRLPCRRSSASDRWSHRSSPR